MIISATPVPGNEKAVTQIVNMLAKIGADVYDKRRGMVHVLGHGSQEELKLMMALTKPRHVMPVHGEAMHLRAHAELAEKMGIPRENIFVADNGDTLEMRGGKVKIDARRGGRDLRGRPAHRRHQPDGPGNRKKLSEDGIVTAIVTLSKETGVFIDAQVVARGVSFDLSDADTINDVSDRLRRSLAKHASTPRNNEADAKLVRDVLASYLWESQHCRPMIVPFVMEV